MRNKIITAADAVKNIKSGMTVAISGHLVSGAPPTLIDALMETDIKDLTTITIGADFTDRGVAKLIAGKRIKKFITSHIGTFAEMGRQYKEGEIEVEFVPIGTMMERLRCAGSGLGGVLTRTAVGTELELGKEKITIDGVDYLLELPLRADVALIYGSIVDKAGNVEYLYTQQNSNPVMAMAGDLVICEANEIVEVGKINPNHVRTPGVLVDYIVQKGR